MALGHHPVGQAEDVERCAGRCPLGARSSPSRAQLGMTPGPQAGAGGKKMGLVKVLSWLPTQGSAMGTLGKGLGSCTAPGWHRCCQDRASGHLPITCLGAQT